MIRDLCKETLSNPGTGTTLTLAGAPSGFRTFASAFGNGVLAYYVLTDGTQWEVQSGTVTTGSPNTMSRGTPIITSAGGTTRLNMTGSCTVYSVAPATRLAYFDQNNALNLASKRLYGLPAAPVTDDEPARYDMLGYRWINGTVFSSPSSGIIFSIPTGFLRFRLEFQDMACSATAALFARWCVDGSGSTFVNGASDYEFTAAEFRQASVASLGSSVSYMPISDSYATSSTASGQMEFAPNGAKTCTFDTAQIVSGGVGWSRYSGATYCNITTTATHVIVGAVGTTLAAGRLRLMGAI
jgi:hypothetical protein